MGFLTFLILGAIVTGQLGFLFPGEGSIYLWTHKAFGPFASFFAGFAAWWPGVPHGHDGPDRVQAACDLELRIGSSMSRGPH